MTSILFVRRSIYAAIVCSVMASPAFANPPQSPSPTPSPRVSLRAKLVKPANSTIDDRYSRGTLRSKETARVKQISVSARVLYAVPVPADPSLPREIPEAAIEVAQGSGGAVRCTFAAKIGPKDPATGKNLVYLLLNAIARKKTVDGVMQESYKAAKGGCDGSVVPVFAANSTATVTIGGVTVLSGIVN